MLTVKLRLTAVSDAQYGVFTTGWSPVSWGSINELFVNLTMPDVDVRVPPLRRLPAPPGGAGVRRRRNRQERTPVADVDSH